MAEHLQISDEENNQCDQETELRVEKFHKQQKNNTVSNIRHHQTGKQSRNRQQVTLEEIETTINSMKTHFRRNKN